LARGGNERSGIGGGVWSDGGGSAQSERSSEGGARVPRRGRGSGDRRRRSLQKRRGVSLHGAVDGLVPQGHVAGLRRVEAAHAVAAAAEVLSREALAVQLQTLALLAVAGF